MRLQVTLSVLILILIPPLIGNAKDPLPDPTRPPASLAHTVHAESSQSATNLDLRAIFFSGGRRLAVINDQRLHEQDRIGSARILRIMPDAVRLIRDGSEFELTLTRLDIKANSNSGSKADQPNDKGTPARTTKTSVSTEPNDAAISATEVPKRPSPTPSTSSTTAQVDPILAPLANSSVAPSTDQAQPHWDGTSGDPFSTQQSDSVPPSGNDTPSWINALLGEGKEK